MVSLASRLVALALVAISAAGCAAPTLPLPPPVALSTPPDADGIVTVDGDALEGAFVSCLNEDTERGVIVRADATTGAFVLRLEASPGDLLTVFQAIDTDRGPAIHLVVPAPSD